MDNKVTYFSDSYVKDYECDLNNRMKLSSLMRVLQKAGTDHLNSLGITYAKMYASGIVFVLSKIGIKINKMPMNGEKYLIRTTPQKTQKASFLRYTAVFNEKGEMMVECQTSWVIINPRERKVLRPAEFKFTLPVEEGSQKCAQILETRIKPIDTAKPVGYKQVKYSDLDINRHMNNCVYGDVIMDYIPEEIAVNKEIDNIFIQYKNEALLGEKVDIKVENVGENSFYVGGDKDEVKCFDAIISFK